VSVAEWSERLPMALLKIFFIAFFKTTFVALCFDHTVLNFYWASNHSKCSQESELSFEYKLAK
jgi:formate/nitrite transporter FocA (FNT family)